MTLSIGPFHFLSSQGSAEDLASGRERPESSPRDLDPRLPQPNSLRRAGEDTKSAVVAATELLRATALPVSERLGVYVGQQQISLDYCARFLEASYREGPRMASPMLFSESVANNVATHLSLTLGLKGIAQTFIGTRAAGIQAVLAAAEDVDSGHVDAGLVVVLGVASSLTRDAYLSVYRPFQRRSRKDVSFLRGSVALLVRRESPGQPRLLYAGVRCAGRGGAAQERSVAALWTDAKARMPVGTRMLESTLLLARERSEAVIRRCGPTLPLGRDLGESYALDPFVRLLLDSLRHRGPEGRAVLCLGEEGTAALIALDGPASLIKV
ncbi:MAG TPA: beta-ketoacyl synthase N-terminal-like domain-containing protein [Planctomycetota bacterium]|nr:beta-ketoacyl synthase N-terminal-like domain-containing protein [Planctomycetota bacterium]